MKRALVFVLIAGVTCFLTLFALGGCSTVNSSIHLKTCQRSSVGKSLVWKDLGSGKCYYTLLGIDTRDGRTTLDVTEVHCDMCRYDFDCASESE